MGKISSPRSINCLFEDGKKSSLAAVRNGDLDRAKTFSTQDNEKMRPYTVYVSAAPLMNCHFGQELNMAREKRPVSTTG